jgi:ABC-type sugar transport system substrate-binding protein
MSVSRNGGNVARYDNGLKRIVTSSLAKLSCIVLLLVVSGCSRSPANRTISAIPQLASQEIYLSERAGLEETAATAGLDVDWNGPSDPDPQRQIDLITAAAASKQYGIVINPIGINAPNSAIQDALSKGIPVVVARDPVSLPPQPHLSFLVEDHASGATLAAKRLREITGGHGDVVILGLEPYSPNSVSRFDAVERALHEYCPSIRVVDRVIAPFSSGDVQIAAERELRQHPALVAFIALNNRAGWGAAAAVAARSGTSDKSNVRVIVFDQSLPLLLRLRRGNVDSIVVQDMRGIGITAVHNIDADRRGHPYDHMVQFKPMLVTLDNINLDETQQALTLNWEPQ